MEGKNKTIIVLWDFTEKSEYAFEHAKNFSIITNMSITLLHVVKSDKEIQPYTQKLSEIAHSLTLASQIQVNAQVIKGVIFKAISAFVSHSHVEMVVMGTHGIKGFQRITGSWALKVIRGSKVPFFVVQEMPTTSKYDNILFPIDFKKENIEKLKWAHLMYNLFKSKIHIIHPKVKDKTFKKRIYSNMIFAKKYFDNLDIPYTIDSVGHDLAKEVKEYAENIQANLIMIAISKTFTFADYLMGPTEQFIIANTAKIPVMVISPKQKLIVSSGFSATGS